MAIRLTWLIILAPVAALLAAGCGPGQNPNAQGQQLGELMAQWYKLAEAPFAEIDDQEAQVLAGQIATRPGGLNALLDVIAAPASRPQEKVLATMCLSKLLTPALEPRLAELTKPGLDTTTRACAVQLLGPLNSDFAQEQVRALLDDEEHTVRFSALSVLLQYGQYDQLGRVAEFWREPEMTARDKTQLVMVAPDSYVTQNPEMFIKALGDLELDPIARSKAALLLANIGGDAAEAALNKAMESDPDPKVKEIAAAALDTLEKGGTGVVSNAPEMPVSEGGEAPGGESPESGTPMPAETQPE